MKQRSWFLRWFWNKVDQAALTRIVSLEVDLSISKQNEALALEAVGAACLRELQLKNELYAYKRLGISHVVNGVPLTTRGKK